MPHPALERLRCPRGHLLEHRGKGSTYGRGHVLACNACDAVFTTIELRGYRRQRDRRRIYGPDAEPFDPDDPKHFRSVARRVGLNPEAIA